MDKSMRTRNNHFINKLPVDLETELNSLKKSEFLKLLVQKRTARYVILFLCLFLLLSLAIWLIQFLSGEYSSIFGACLIGIIVVQLGFFAHDAQHHQIFDKPYQNIIASYIFSNLCCGISHAWWSDKHMRHHAFPNKTDFDPDIYPQFTYTEQQALDRDGLYKIIARYQAWLYIPIVLFSAIYFRILSIGYLFDKQVKYKICEIALLFLHHGLYGYLFFAGHDIRMGMALYLTSCFTSGLYMAYVFTPNHMGMPLYSEKQGAIRTQIETTRNIKSGKINQLVFGGLNQQIEHHLFPGMSRWNLATVKPRVEQLCKESGILYHEVSVFDAYKEIFAYLNKIGEPLRKAG